MNIKHCKYYESSILNMFHVISACAALPSRQGVHLCFHLCSLCSILIHSACSSNETVFSKVSELRTNLTWKLWKFLQPVWNFYGFATNTEIILACWKKLSQFMFLIQDTEAVLEHCTTSVINNILDWVYSTWFCLNGYWAVIHNYYLWDLQQADV